MLWVVRDNMTKYIKNLQTAKGKASFCLIPKIWMDENGIIKGDSMLIETIGDIIIIKPLNSKVPATTQSNPIQIPKISNQTNVKANLNEINKNSMDV